MHFSSRTLFTLDSFCRLRCICLRPVLQHKHRLFEKAQQNLNLDEDWILASSHFGVKTYYRREEDQSLTVKLEGELKDVPLFEQVCVLKEIDLHHKWAPFCSSSMTVADLGKLDCVGWFLVGLPNFGIARDGCFRAIGCDNFQEDGSFILVGQGIHDKTKEDPSPYHSETFLSDDRIIDELEIPPIPERRGSGRMTIRKFEAVVNVLSPTSVKTRLVANIDPNLSFLPQTLLEFGLKHLAGSVLVKLQGAAKKITMDPVHNDHAKRMREEEEFYKEWLMPKFQAVCHEKGWTMPVVSAFELTDEQLQKESRKLEKKPRLPRRRASSMNFDLSGDDQNILENIDEVAARDSNNNTILLEGTDSVSDLSTKSSPSYFIQNNPVAMYLREMEEKTKQRKAEIIEESRKIAADRLKPKDISKEQKMRLEQLKHAKLRRLGKDTGRNQERGLFRYKFDIFSGHERLVRFIVVTSLVGILFSMLYSGTWWNSHDTDDQLSWRPIISEIAIFLVQLVLCSVAHFVLCDVALIYAFDALDIGAMSGRQIKKFYRDNVRIGVAAGSIGILSFSIFKSVAKTCVQVFLWYGSEALLPFWEAFLQGASKVVAENAFFSLLYDSICSAVFACKWTVRIPVNLTLEYLIRSNFLGLNAERLVRNALYLVFLVINDVHVFCKKATGSFEGRAALLSWRTEAFETAQFIFSYSAVFLLATLILFILSARFSNLQVFRDDDSTSSRGGKTKGPLPNSPSSVSEGNTETNSVRSPHVVSALPNCPSSVSEGSNSVRSTHVVPIPENAEVCINNGPDLPQGHFVTIDGSIPTANARSRRLRFRRKQNIASPGFEERNERRRTYTM